VDYLNVVRDVDHAVVRTELLKLENELYGLRSGGQEDVERLVRTARLAKNQIKFWDEKFSPQDWARYIREDAQNSLKKDSGIESRLQGIEGYVSQEEKRLNIDPSLGSGSNDVKSEISSLSEGTTLNDVQKKFMQEAYYRLAFKRDDVMVNNLLRMAEEMGQDRVVLIAGGFHSRGMTSLLRQKGVPYVVIQPRISFSPGSEVPGKEIPPTFK